MLDVGTENRGWRVVYIATDGKAPPEYVEHWRRRFRSFKAIPEKTALAVAVLRMHGAGVIVEGYGQKVSDDTYWVDSTPERVAEYKVDNPKKGEQDG